MINRGIIALLIDKGYGTISISWLMFYVKAKLTGVRRQPDIEINFM